MPIVRAKFRNVTIGAASKPLTGWSWKNTSNLLHRDEIYSSFSPDSTPLTTNGEGTTYGTYYITLSNLDFVFPNQLQSNFKLSLNWKYKLEGTGLQPKITSAIMILPSGVTGKEKIIEPFNLTITNSGIDLELAEGFWTNTDQSQSLLFSQLNNVNFRIRVGIDFVLNNYDSSIDNFGIDYFYLVVSWNHRYGVTRSAFTSASVLTRTNVSTDNISVPTILGSSSGWAWNNPSNALVDDNSHSFYSKPTVHNFGRTSTSSNYGQADWYVTDYLYLRNLQTKVSVSSEIVGIIIQFKKRASLQKFTNGYTEVVAFDDEVRLYNGSSIIGENKRGPRRTEARELVPWPKEENNSNISWFGWLPGGSGNNNSQYYGEQADNWGLTNITPTLVNDSNFGILISPRFSVHWWEKATWPIPWGVNFANIAIYYKLYNTEEFITPENLPSEESFASLPIFITSYNIDVNSIQSDENLGLSNILDENIFNQSIASDETFDPYLTFLITQAYVYPDSIDSTESFSLIFERFIEPLSIESFENIENILIDIPVINESGNLLSSFLNFEVIPNPYLSNESLYTWDNVNGGKYFNDNDSAYQVKKT